MTIKEQRFSNGLPQGSEITAATENIEVCAISSTDRHTSFPYEYNFFMGVRAGLDRIYVAHTLIHRNAVSTLSDRYDKEEINGPDNEGISIKRPDGTISVFRYVPSTREEQLARHLELFGDRFPELYLARFGKKQKPIRPKVK